MPIYLATSAAVFRSHESRRPRVTMTWHLATTGALCGDLEPRDVTRSVPAAGQRRPPRPAGHRARFVGQGRRAVQVESLPLSYHGGSTN